MKRLVPLFALLAGSLFAEIKTGMTEADLLKEKGPPTTQAALGDRALYSWPDVQVTVEKGVVTKVSPRPSSPPATTAGNPGASPKSAQAAPSVDSSELVKLLGQPLPGGMTVTKWDKSRAPRVRLHGSLKNLASDSETATALMQFVDRLGHSPQVDRADPSSITKEPNGQRLIFEIDLQLKNTTPPKPQGNLAYSRLLELIADAPNVKLVTKNAATGIVSVRSQKTGALVVVDTEAYTAETVGKVLQKLADNDAAFEKPDPANPLFVVCPALALPPIPLEFRGEKFPAYLTAYPGATTRETAIHSANGTRVYEYTAVSGEKPTAILEFYSLKLAPAGYEVSVNNVTLELEARSKVNAPKGEVRIVFETRGNRQALMKLIAGVQEKP